VAAVGRRLPGAPLEGVDAGLHVVLRLPDDADDLDVVARCERLGVAVSPLSAYAAEAPHRGLVICYAGLPESRADAAVRLLSEALTTG
ncbi:MAG TPA: PLP-dependent aminotransferase family protein, partial [Phycicoccus sp.]|nr:PLP-dependent aminotransferase family protein [Phycicoccus sp.]